MFVARKIKQKPCGSCFVGHPVVSKNFHNHSVLWMHSRCFTVKIWKTSWGWAAPSSVQPKLPTTNLLSCLPAYLITWLLVYLSTCMLVSFLASQVASLLASLLTCSLVSLLACFLTCLRAYLLACVLTFFFSCFQAFLLSCSLALCISCFLAFMLPYFLAFLLPCFLAYLLTWYLLTNFTCLFVYWVSLNFDYYQPHPPPPTHPGKLISSLK